MGKGRISKKIIVNLSFTISLGFIFLLLSIFGTFEKLDFRLYDGLLRFTKEPEMSENVTVVAITNEDIGTLGEWPWSRDILADTIIQMKEFGAANAVFDIEYISPSKLALANRAAENVNSKVNEVYGTTLDIIDGVISYAQYGTSASDISKIKEDLIDDALTPVYQDFCDYIDSNMAFNNDDYLAKALEFFGNAYLTVNYQDLNIDITPEEIEYIKNRHLNFNLQGDSELVKKNNDSTFSKVYSGEAKGFTPAMHKLVTGSRGLGFTNSLIDSDGTRRRMELLYEYDGKFVGQLVLTPIMDLLDTKDITRKKNYLIINNALFPGEDSRCDIKIPLDEYGRMLINWQHEIAASEVDGTQYGVKTLPVSNIYRIKQLEENIADVIYILSGYNLLDENGELFDYCLALQDLVSYYNDIKSYKAYLLDKCRGFDENGNPVEGILDDEYEAYFSAKKDYMNQVVSFLNGDSLNVIQDVLLSDGAYDEASENFVEGYKNALSQLYSLVLSEEDNGYVKSVELLNQQLNNQFCIIGMTASSTTDLGAVPFVQQYANVYIHANVANTILSRDFIKSYPWYVGFIAAFILSVILAFLAETSSVVQNLVSGLSRLALIAIFILSFVFGNMYFPLVGGVLLFSILNFIAEVAYRYLLSSRERKYITEVASSFANKDTVEMLRKNPELFNTVGEKKVITALFSDVQKFSTLSESIGKIYGEEAPNKLISILNDYLGDMSNEILFNNGTIDKYEGDAIISMFGAPDPLNKYTPAEWAYLCLDSAIRMKKKEVEFNENHPELFVPVDIKDENGNIKETVQLKPLQTRIGINTGDAFVGMMGSKTDSFNKLNYTMMGDTVNLASRLEGVNKAYASWIMCSDDTWNLANSGANEGKIVARRLDKVRVVGRATPVQLYNILGFSDEFDETKKENLCLFNEALDLYLDKNFAEAEAKFRNLYERDKSDPTPLVFAERCLSYKEKGVSDNWDGVMNMTSK